MGGVEFIGNGERERERERECAIDDEVSRDKETLKEVRAIGGRRNRTLCSMIFIKRLPLHRHHHHHHP